MKSNSLPVGVVQLLETPFVNLINFAFLVTTNAARHRFVAGKDKLVLDFRLLWAQGPELWILPCFLPMYPEIRGEIEKGIRGDIEKEDQNFRFTICFWRENNSGEEGGDDIVLMSLLRVTIKTERDHLEDIHRDRDMQERNIQFMSDYTGPSISGFTPGPGHGSGPG
ncbi:hypothetical protein LXL04_026893 [Taraxacum kok-saghyz]